MYLSIRPDKHGKNRVIVGYSVIKRDLHNVMIVWNRV